MKANAPEKIYLQVCGDCQDNECENCKFDDFEDNITWCKDRIFPKDIEYTRTDAFIEKAKEAFCKATCNGHPPRSTCTSLGTCKEYDNFVKLLKRE